MRVYESLRKLTKGYARAQNMQSQIPSYEELETMNSFVKGNGR